MSKQTRAFAVLVAAVGACLVLPLAGSAAGKADAVCPQDTMTFTGTAYDLTIPAGGYCAISGATITHDLIQLDEAGADIDHTSIGNDVIFHEDAGAGIVSSTIGHDVRAEGFDSGADITDSWVGHDFLGLGEESGADVLRTTIAHDMLLLGAGGGTHLESVTIGHDFHASQPQSVQTGHNSPRTPGGPVSVGHDFTVDGSPALPFVFDSFCWLTVGRDFAITNRTVTLGFAVGANCTRRGQPNVTTGRDLVVTGDTAVSGVFGPSSILVWDNSVGRDLVFENNTAAGRLEVSRNAVTRDATCAANSPAVTVNGANTAGRSNTCG